jgi:hypothetical protein
MGEFIGTLTAGNIASDVMGAVPVKDPATGARTTSDGTPVSATTPRGHVYTAAFIVLGAMFVLLGGARFLRDARIA